MRSRAASQDGQRRPGGQIIDATLTVAPQRAVYRPAPIDIPMAMSSSLIAWSICSKPQVHHITNDARLFTPSISTRVLR
jgi:hypothetical protein